MDAIAPQTTVGAVHLTVSDLTRSVDYYRDAVGLGVLEDGAAEGRKEKSESNIGDRFGQDRKDLQGGAPSRRGDCEQIKETVQRESRTCDHRDQLSDLREGDAALVLEVHRESRAEAAALPGLRESLLAIAVSVGSGLHVALRILAVDVLAGLLTVSVLSRGGSR